MLAIEVAEVMRLSKRALIRREREGILGLTHVDRVGGELIFAKADLVHALGIGGEGVSLSGAADPAGQHASWGVSDPITMEWARRKNNPRSRPRLTKGMTPPAWFLEKNGKPPGRRSD